MRRIPQSKAAVLFGILTLLLPACMAQSRAGTAVAANPGGFSGDASGACMIQPDAGLLPGCIIKDAEGVLSIAPKYRKLLRVDSHGLAAAWSESEPKGWMYVDRKGRVVVTGVAAFDNWADTFHDGLVRVTRDNRFGFANRAGVLVIPAVYDGAFNFEKGRAAVCQDCKRHCDGEHCGFEGGRWLRIDRRGHVVREVQGP